MSAERRSPIPLTIVSASTPDDPQTAGDGADWSKLMARSQYGDREAYRTLLEGVTPYIRSLASRCFKQPTDVEDAVQDVLLIPFIWSVMLMIQVGPLARGWRQ